MSVRAVAALAVALATAACGGGGDGGERRAGGDAGRDPFVAVERDRGRDAGAAPRAAPRWEPVAALEGSGRARPRLVVDDRAIQWRVRWRCDRGEMRLDVRPRRRRVSPLARAGCPARGEATSVVTGTIALDVDAAGPWRLEVEQQVDTPLRERTLRAVRDGTAERVAGGRFYGLERRGRGEATLFRLPGDRLALRFAGFETAASADLFVWVSRDPRPRSSREALASRHVEVGPLKATAGSQNYVLPRRLRPGDLRSVVIWCEPIRIAYAAAGLRRSPSG